MFDFEQFPVYLKSESFYAKTLKLTSNPKINKPIRDQLQRAALSIVLNIAEGSGKFTKNDKKNFYIVAKGSTNECVAILRILKIEANLTNHLFEDLYKDLLEIAKMLSGLINAMIDRKS